MLCGMPHNLQLFSASMTLQPHLHLLVPQGVFDGATFIELPPPSQEEVAAVLARMLAQAQRTFESMEAAWPKDAFEALQRQSAQERLDLGELPEPSGRARLVAVGMGFSLHAGTQTHANDREALARLCRYGARGPIAESRLTLLEDGRYEYQTKKGITLVLTAAQLTRRLISLIPPARLHLVNFYGAFSSHSKARSTLLPKAAPCAETPPAPDAPPATPKTKRPRIDWATLHARTWNCDVWRCHCGGKRRVTAVVTNRSTAEEMLRNMGRLPPSPPPTPLAQAPPQLELLVP